MLKFCQDRASPGILRLAQEIVATEPAKLKIDTLDISSIVGDVNFLEVFVLWVALGRNPNCASLGQLLARFDPPEGNIDK